MQDLRLAIRALRATPIVTVVAILSLALGIGANTAIFSLVNSLLLRALPIVEPHRMVMITSDNAISRGFTAAWTSPIWMRRPRRFGACSRRFAMPPCPGSCRRKSRNNS